MQTDSAEIQRQQIRFHRQMLFLGPIVLLWMYSVSDTFRFKPPANDTDRFIAEYRIGYNHDIPICRPPKGADIYLRGSRWKWQPELILTKGGEYTLHVSSSDVDHGLDLDAFGLHTTVTPGHDQSLTLTASQTGDFEFRCDEYCGPGHEVMTGRIIVQD